MGPKLRWNYVKWIDHSGYHESNWKSDEELVALTPFIIESTGVVIKETDTYIVLVAHYSDEGQRGTGEMCILKNCIMERKGIIQNDHNQKSQSD